MGVVRDISWYLVLEDEVTSACLWATGAIKSLGDGDMFDTSKLLLSLWSFRRFVVTI